MNLYQYHPDPENAPYREWAYENVPALVWEKYKHCPLALKKREKVLAKEAYYAYWYAWRVLKGPFPAGEAALAKDAHFSYRYAVALSWYGNEYWCFRFKCKMFFIRLLR